MASSLRVPEDLKKRIASLAEERQTTPHAFMLEAIREKVEAEEARVEFEAEAERRLKRMKRSGRAIPAEEVFEYLTSKAEGKAGARPKARRM